MVNAEPNTIYSPGASGDDPDQPGLTEGRIVRALELAQAYLDLQADLGSALKDAVFELAQARYTMGSNSVGQAQYPAAMTANIAVECKQDQFDQVKYSLTRNGQQSAAAADRQSSGIETGIQEAVTGKAQRESSKPSTASEQYGSMLQEFADKFGCSKAAESDDFTSEADSSQRHIKQPAQWFGAMPSRHIKAAQCKHQQVLDLIVQLASLCSTLHHTMKRAS